VSKTGPDFYDDEAVFATYQRHRQRVDTANDTLEKPVILELVDPVANKRILDLGCGRAMIGKEFLQQGAASYTGVEGSKRMVEAAIQTLTGTSGHVIQQTIEAWVYPPEAFDLVLSRLALHYVADLVPVFTHIFQTLAAGGQFVFSVEHPVITSCDRGWSAETRRQDWVVDDYFSTGVRVTYWMGDIVQKYHRTVEDYFYLLQTIGFQLEHLREARPQRHHFQDLQTYERRKRIPLFLILAARKAI
jgi:SAM-dependent methyltransferase